MSASTIGAFLRSTAAGWTDRREIARLRVTPARPDSEETRRRPWAHTIRDADPAVVWEHESQQGTHLLHGWLAAYVFPGPHLAGLTRRTEDQR
jgi:hypothetical protein